MKQHIALGMFMVASLMTSACYTTRITFAPATKVVPSVNMENEWYHGAVYGLSEISNPVRVNEACPEGKVAYVDQETTFVNGFVENLTGGLYNPQTVTVMCSAE